MIRKALHLQGRPFGLFSLSTRLCCPTNPPHTRAPLQRSEHLQLYRKFEKQVKNPDWTRITLRRAKRWFILTSDDLAAIDDKGMRPHNPRDHSNSEVHQFWIKDIVPIAIKKYGSAEKVLANFEDYLQNRHNLNRREALSGYETSPPSLSLWKQVRSAWSQVGRKPTTTQLVAGEEAVFAGLCNNSAILALKAAVYGLTGSMAIFADMMHSFADVITYSYRWYALSYRKTASTKHPYGYTLYRYLIFDRSQVLIFTFGGMLPLLHGVASLRTSYELEWPAAVMFVFFFAAWRERATMMSAYKQLQKTVGQLEALEHDQPVQNSKKPSLRSIVKYIIRGRSEVFTVSTFLEGALGCFGAFVGIGGALGTVYTGNCMYDWTASMLIAMSVASLSFTLASKNAPTLLAQSIPEQRVTAVNRVLEMDSIVMSVADVKTIILGSSSVRYKCEIEINPEEVTRRIRDVSLQTRHAGTLASQPHHTNAPSALAEEMGALAKNPDKCEDWLMRNNALFYVTLSSEIKRLETLVKAELSEYREVHVDIELW